MYNETVQSIFLLLLLVFSYEEVYIDKIIAQGRQRQLNILKSCEDLNGSRIHIQHIFYKTNVKTFPVKTALKLFCYL